MQRPTVPMIPAPLRHRGFSLIELAIVLVIVALLSGGLVMSLGAQLEQRARNDTLSRLETARDALIGYAASHQAANGKPYLPCPDTTGDGQGDWDPIANACIADEGFLPSVDLAVEGSDAWENRLRYRVTPAFVSKQSGFTLTSDGQIQTCTAAGCATPLASKLPAIILSHGPNGLGATHNGGAPQAAPSAADELENTNGNLNFVQHETTAAPFDDLVVGLSPNLLFNRLIAAGRLP